MEKCIIVTTLSNNLDIINKIQKELLEKRLVSGCQISKVDPNFKDTIKFYENRNYIFDEYREKEICYHKIIGGNLK